MKKPELLSPAGNMECLHAAIEAGCDAVYIGGKHFGARNYAINFTDEEMIEAINYSHLYGVKVYVTVNTMITEELVKPFIKYIDFLHKNNVDAIIISDIGMIDYIRQVYPNLEVHASTQMHIHNLEGAKFIESLGLKRVVLARETNIELIDEIKKNTNIELEVFIHGALCISYSGECLMSSLIGGRSGNKGTCSQSCRMKKVNKDNYLLSTKDLNTLNNIGSLIDIGVDSLKIEGRMKSKEYVYFVTKLYRKAIDSYINNKTIDIKEEDIINLKKIFNRNYTKGFLNNEENNKIVNQYRPNPIGEVVSVKNNFVKIKLIDELNLRDGIRILNDIEDYGTTIYKMKKDNIFVEKAFNKDIIELKFEHKININVGDKVVKTTDIKLVNLIEEQIKNKTRKISINGIIKCKLNEPIIFKISDGINDIEIKGKIVEKSINNPITKERIEEQINKLGNTIYKFNKLDLIVDDNIFINIKDLNEIRREGIEKLNQKRLKKQEYKKLEYNNEVKEYTDEVGYTSFIHNLDNYDKLVNSKEIIVDDIDLYNEKVLDSRVILKLPRVIYNYPNYNIKVMVGEYGSLNKYNDMISDFSFNVANSYSVAFLHNHNVKRVTLSLELKEEEIKKLIENYKERYNKKPNLELIVSSIPEVMVSKFNLIKYYNIPNSDNYLRDKFKNNFKIKIKDNLMYIYHFKRIEIEDHKKLFDMGINRLRIEYDE
jgi:putative protease